MRLRHSETRTDRARDTARARLRALAGTSLRRVELWDAAGSRLLEISVPDATAGDAAPKVLPPASPPSIVSIGALQVSDGTVFTDAIAEILDETSAAGRLGYVCHSFDVQGESARAVCVATSVGGS